jgi:hypothetical protein
MSSVPSDDALEDQVRVLFSPNEKTQHLVLGLQEFLLPPRHEFLAVTVSVTLH